MHMTELHLMQGNFGREQLLAKMLLINEKHLRSIFASHLAMVNSKQYQALQPRSSQEWLSWLVE
jgi:hypothetical protein